MYQNWLCRTLFFCWLYIKTQMKDDLSFVGKTKKAGSRRKSSRRRTIRHKKKRIKQLHSTSRRSHIKQKRKSRNFIGGGFFRYVLAIIDMQESYPWGRDDDFAHFVNNVTKVVKKSIKDNAYIMVIELTPEDRKMGGSTIPVIQKLLEDYNNKSLIVSEKRDKHLYILKELCAKDIQTEYLLIVGVNADECILETAKGAVKSKNCPRVHIGPIHTFNMENEQDKMNNFCWAVEELEKLKAGKRLKIGKPTRDLYKIYDAMLEQDDEDEAE